MDRASLAGFLRARRQALRPDDVGLPSGPRRRVEGLRREEVAQLASMSVDYYTRLEQGRGPQPSIPMLAVLARVLRLTLDERDHLYRLAGHNAPDRVGGSGHVAPALLRVLDRLADTPALIIDDLGETLAQNRLAEAIFGDASRYTGLERSGVYRWFADPDVERRVYSEHDRDRQSRALVASLRFALGRRGSRSVAAEIVRVLERRSDEFVRLWARQEVAARFEDHKVLVHPEVGPIEFDCQALFTEDQSQALLVLTAAPRSADEEKIALLGLVGAVQFRGRQTTGADGG